MSQDFENYFPPKELIPSDPRFGCGPSLLPEEFVRKLHSTGPHLLGTSHRQASVKSLVKIIQERVRQYFGLSEDYLVVVGNGGATFLFDAIGLGLVRHKSVHFTCGEFSAKWWKAHENIPWIETVNMAVELGHGVYAESRENADLICCTLNETSTGVIVPSLPSVDEDVLLCVDATSGGGQVECDVSKVDVFFFSPQKVFASEGGTFIAVLSAKAQKRALELAEDSSRYIPDIMNWKTHINNAQKNQTYTTPCVSSLFFLNEQLELMREVGYQSVVEEGKKRAELIYGWAQAKDYLRPYVKEEEFRSSAVATIDVDDRVNVTPLLKRLREQKVVYGIESYRKLGRNQFRIALFYNIKFEDLEKLTKLLSHAIESYLH